MRIFSETHETEQLLNAQNVQEIQVEECIQQLLEGFDDQLRVLDLLEQVYRGAWISNQPAIWRRSHPSERNRIAYDSLSQTVPPFSP